MTGSSDSRLQRILEQASSPEFQDIMRRAQDRLPDKPTYQDYQIGLRSLHEHILVNTPEVLTGGLHIVDVGPGVGCFMVLARAYGNAVQGEEADPSTSTVVNVYQEITSYWALDIRYRGFHRYLSNAQPFPYADNSVDLFHFRGSLDAVLRSCSSSLSDAVVQAIQMLNHALVSGGRVWIGHNQDELLTPILAAIEEHCAPLKIVPSAEFITQMVKP